MKPEKSRKVVVVEQGTIRHETVSTLADLQKIVGGYIEAVCIDDRYTVYVNEEGKLLGLDPTMLWLEGQDILRGPVVFDGAPTRAGNSSQLKGKAAEAAAEFAAKNMIAARNII